MKRKCLVALSVALSVLILSACTALAPVPEQPLEQRTVQLEALNDYRVTGGLGIWTDEQSLSARVNWLENDGELTVHLSGPLGIGNIKLVSRPGNVTVSRGGSSIGSGTSIDRVVQNALGLSAPVPMQQLQRWVRGLPGNAHSIKRDQQGKLSSLRFTDADGVGWQARFLQYSDFNGLAVPALITASGGPYSVRLRLKDWTLYTADVVPEETQSDRRLAIPER